ncbi:cytochrome c oxidase subunit II [soil metagenome]
MQRVFQRGMRGTAARLGILSMVVLLTITVVLPSVAGAQSPYSTVSPATPQANDIHDIYKLTFWLALIVFIGVQVGIVYTVLRFRRRADDEERPEQMHGHKTLEIVWTIVPAIILLVIFIPTVQTIFAHSDELSDPDMVVQVYGKQWWWEVHYTEPDEISGVVTGNEIRLPQGKRVVFELFTNNVIHSFWVPQLHGKLDLIPGHVNRMAIDTERPGYYFGQCAEFCGDSHALMRFKVIIEPEEQFNAWVDSWRAGPSASTTDYVPDGDLTQVPTSFGLCLACHNIEGTSADLASTGLEQQALTDTGGPGSAKTAGPNLSLFGCRTTIAAGTLTNTPENLAIWLQNPGAVKPGNHMQTVIGEGTLSDDQIAELVGYLESLQPDGGCPETPEQPGVEEQSQVTDPD